MMYPGEPIINDSNFSQYQQAPVIDGEEKGFGLVMPDEPDTSGYSQVRPFDIPLIPQSEWKERIEQMERSNSRLSDIRMEGNAGRMIPSLDQGSSNYCWAHSPTAAAIMSRAVEGQPYVRLSAFSVAVPIKSGRNEGGWNPEAAQRIATHGVASVDAWPERSFSRTHDNPNTWRNAEKYKVTEGFWDLRLSKYDRNLTFQQLMTCLLLRIPCPVDLMWWRHSVLALDPVWEQGQFGIRIWNSWGDNWGSNGMGVILGQKAIPDGATAFKSMLLAA